MEIIAGKTRSNTAAAILSNTTDLENAYVDALHAEGSAYKENEKYMNSIQGKIDLFNNAVQTLWNNTLDDAWIKGFVDFGTEIVKLIDNVGMLTTALIALTAVKLVPWLLKGITSAETFGGALKTFLAPLTYITGTKQTLASFFAQTAADAMNAAGGVSTFGSYLKAAGKTLKAFVHTPLGWFTLIALAIGAVVTVVDLLTTSIKELEEELDNLNSEINDIEGEIESLNSELETTRERMEELLALPSLSFTEQEELRNLKLQTAELEKQLELRTMLLKSKEKERSTKAKEWISDVWNGEGIDKKYWVSGNGTIAEDVWWLPGVSGKKSLETSLPKYKELQKETSDMESLYLLAQKEFNKNGKLSANIRQSILDSVDIKYPKIQSDKDIISKLDDAVNSYKETLGRMETGINMVLGDMADTISKNELSYSMGDENINEFLNDYYAYYDAWNVAQGISTKSDVISNMFGTIASEEVQKLGESLREIANNENLSLDEQRSKIEGIINSIDQENVAYTSLKQTMNTVGITAQDIADYFTLDEGLFDSDTIQGITNQYLTALEIMKKLKGMSYGREFSIGDTRYDWNTFFTENDNKQFEANAEKFSEILKGMDENCRKTFMSLSEQVKNGELTWEQAITSFSHSGNLAGLKILEEQIISLNNIEFKGITDKLSGVIDTFSEFGAALEEVSASMDLLNTAQTQMNNSNRISVTTALEIMNSTDRWNEILEIENGNIRLVGNATEILVENKLDLIKANLQNALSTIEEQLAMVDATVSSDEMTMTMEESTNQAVRQLAGSMAYLTTMTEAYTRAANGEKINVDEYMESAKAAQAEAEAALNWKVDSANQIDRSEYEKRKEEIQAQLAILEGIDTYDEHKNYYDFDKTPGDKYNDSDTKDKLDALRKQYENKIALLEAQQTYLQNEIDRMEAEGEQVGKAIYEEQIRLENEKLKLYEQERAALLEQMKTVAKGSDEWYEHANAVWETEHAIQKSTLAIVEYKQAITSLYVEAFSNIEEAFTNLNKLYEYRQNYIRNNIENIELTGDNVSADSYKNLIDIQKESVASYENQIKSLQDTLNQGLADGSIKEGSKEWIDLQFRVYDATLSMQEARNEIENINEELKELYLTAFDKVKEAFDALDDLHSDRQSYVENYMHYMELIGEPIPTSGYEYLIEEENKKLADNMQELYVLREKLADAVNNGNIKVGSEQWIELESNIRDTEAAILDNKIAIEEYNQELKNLYVEAFDKVKDAFGNETNLYDDQQAFIESYIDYLDVIGVKVPTEMYDKLIAIEKQKQQANMQQLEDLRASLANMEANGISPNDEEWVQAQADIRAVEAAIWDSEKAMAQFNKTIQEMETEKFEEFIKRIGDVVDELENVYDILSDEDVATEDGAWTAEGITSLGLMVQKMEIAQKQIQEYQKEIDKLTDSYKAGEISEQDYNDRLVELKNSQWDAIDAYESAKDAIVDINEARIDMIEEGINKEVEAYEELIDLKKKELDSERDLFEFRKNIKNQTKDIASLERRIAAMSGSTDAATIAERTKLEAQLREAQENLDDTYYSHAMDSQSSAFDDEQEAYVTSKEDYVEMLRETLKDVEQVVTDTMTQVLINADTVLGELNGVSSEYGITLSDSLTTPWINAASQAETFKNSAIAQQYEFVMQNGIFTGTINGQLDEMFGAGSLAATNFQNGVNANIEAIRLKVETSTSEMTSNLQIPFETALSYAQNTFSPRVRAELQAVADKAKELAPDEETDLITPFKQGTASANTFSDEAEEAIKNVAETAAEYNPTLTEDLTAPPKAGENAWDLFGQKVSDVLSGMVADANTAASSISSSMDAAIAKAKSAVAAIAKAGSSGGSTLNPSLNPPEPTLEPPPQEPVTTEKKKTKYHTYIKYANSYYYQCGSDASGKNYSGYYLKRKNKIPYTAKLMAAANETLYYKGGSSGSKMFAFPAFKHPIIYAGGRGYVEEYAKGTLGIKKDQWAIDSEPQFGDELVLVPNKGVLSYMRKGTSVIPSDLTENLIEWGKLNPDMTTLSNGVQNTNLMTNVINKPETNFEFDSLLHIDNCSNEAIPEVRKIVEEQLNKFARNLNYNLKRVGSN